MENLIDKEYKKREKAQLFRLFIAYTLIIFSVTAINIILSIIVISLMSFFVYESLIKEQK